MASSSSSASPAPTCQHFAIVSLGDEGGKSHTEYVFRVRHYGGCEWAVRKRYVDLLDLHEKLCTVFGSSGLPTFPPKHPGLEFLGVLMGAETKRTMIQERVEAFQAYFDQLCSRRDVTGLPCFQAAMAVAAPEPPSQLRVRGWLPAARDEGCEGALVDIKAEEQQVERSAVVEVFHISARLSAEDGKAGNVVVDMQVPASAPQASGATPTALIEGLPVGAQVELEVCCVNAVARSPPVSIRLLVPDRGPQSTATASTTASSSGSDKAVPDVGPLPGQSVEDKESELERRRQELEAWWSQRQQEAAIAEQERARQMEEFQAQRLELEQKREELNRQYSERLSGQGSPPCMSPRSSDSQVPDPEASQQLWEDLRRRQEEADRIMEQLQLQREQQRKEAEEIAAERKLIAEEAQAQQAEVQRRLASGGEAPEDLLALRSELATQRAELERQQQELLQQQERVQMENGSGDATARPESSVRELGEALERERAKLERERAEEEGGRRRQAMELEQQEQELRQKAEELSRAEEALLLERQELTRSRASLAVVQAHVVRMLDGVSGGPKTAVAHRIDDDSLPRDEDGVGPDDNQPVPRASSVHDRVWSMDWTTLKTPREGVKDVEVDESPA